MNNAPTLWPPVRRWEPTGGGITEPRSLPDPATIADPSLPAEGYRLQYDPDGTRLHHADDAGRRHGLATLAQLRGLAGPLPAGVITDDPDFPVRGVMLDISRDRVPRRSEIELLIEQVAGLKGNHLQLYVEHSIAYVGHAAVAGPASAISLEELAALGRYAAERGVTLAANQNTFGHCERWLRYQRYAHLGELPDAAARIARGDRSFFSLSPSVPAARRFACDLLDQQLTALPGPWANIGCDETVDVGQGRSAERVQRDGFAPVWADHAGAVCRHVLDGGRTPLFWADMALDHPAALGLLPQEAVALAWNYEADAPFARWAAPLNNSGHPWWACPGASGWRSFVGRSDARTGSISAAAREGLAGGASGLLVTEWGDCGHRQPWPIAWFGLAEGLGAGWNAAASATPDYSALGLHALGSAALGPWLDAVGRVDIRQRQEAVHPVKGTALINTNLPFQDTQVPITRRTWQPNPAAWRHLAERWAALAAAQPASGDAVLDAECALALRAVALACDRAIARRCGDRALWLPAAWRELAEEHRRQWLRRARPGGLADSCAWYESLAAEWERAHG